MAQIRVIWDTAAIKMWCNTPGGPADRGMSRLSDDALQDMKRRCPVSTGALRASIRKFRQPDGDYLIGPTRLVGPPWQPPQLLGPLVEGGTPRHDIESHGPWPLRDRATGRVFGHRQPNGRWLVHHPGTRPQPFIAPAARDLGGKVIRI